jgi:uncharacterized delta-60 repeat protein
MKNHILRLIVFLNILVGSSTAQNGTIIPFYGQDGIAKVGLSPVQETYYNSYGRSIAISASGKIWVAGDYDQHDKQTGIFLRLTAAGVLDPEFNATGVMPGTKVVSFGGDSTFRIQDIKEDGQGRLVFCGIMNSGGVNAVVAGRLLPGGQADLSFGNKGFSIFQYSPGGDQCYDLIVLPDNSVIISMLFNIGSPNNDLGLLKLKSDGLPDETFGDNAIARIDVAGYSDFTNRMVLDEQSRIIMAGQATTSGSNRQAAIFRFTSNGFRDSAFGNAGIVLVPVASGQISIARALSVQAGNKIVVTGTAFPQFGFSTKSFLCRFDSLGIIDPGFSNFGIANTPEATLGNIDPFDLKPQSDGKLVLSTQVSLPQQNHLFRFTADGILDSGYGDSGQFVLQGSNPLYPNTLESYRSLMLSDDNVLVISRCNVTDNLMGLIVSKVNSTGVLDVSFNGSGQQVPVFTTNSDRLSKLLLMSDGSALVIGTSLISEDETLGQGYAYAMAKLQPNGRLDPGFGNGGKQVLDIGAAEARANTAALGNNGKFYVGGLGTVSNNEFVVLGLNANGSLDQSFATNGKFSMPMGTGTGGGRGVISIAIDQGNRLLVAGFYHDGGGLYATVLRLLPDGTLDASFGSGGKFVDAMPYSQFGGEMKISVGITVDGKYVLVAGNKSTQPSQGNWRVLKLTASGSLDATFSGDGIAEIDYGNESLRLGEAIIGYGAFVYIVGTYGNTTSTQKVLVGKLTPDGNLDSSFGSNGFALLNLSAGSDQGESIYQTALGNVFVTGTGFDPGNPSPKARVAWLTTLGTLVTGFGNQGVVTIDNMGSFYGISLASSPFGTIYSAGYGSSDYSREDFWVAALQVPSELPATYFRTKQSGRYHDPFIWEYSSDSLSWTNATKAPGLGEKAVSIQSGHIVTFEKFNQEINNVTVQSGATFKVLPNSYIRLVQGSAGHVSLKVNGEMIIESGGPIDIEGNSGATLLVNGKLSMNTGAITLQNAVVGQTGLIIGASGELYLNAPEGQGVVGLTNLGTVNWRTGNIVMKTGSSLHNYGRWNDSASHFFSTRSPIRFRNFGTYRKHGGASALGGSSGSSMVNFGNITGVGSLNLVRGDSSANLGVINPGDPIGTLVLQFSQSNTISTLNIEMDSTQVARFDQLVVNGQLILGGTLNVNELTSMPEGSYTIVRKGSSGSVTGTFASTNLPPNYTIQYMTDSVVLTKIASVPPKNISISSPTAITEGNYGQRELKFVVRLSQASAGTVRVDYSTIDSTATAGTDYTAISGSLTIPAGQLTDTIRVQINGDRLVEAVERFKVMLSNPVNAIVTTGQAIGTINNDDALPAVSITNYTITEGTGRDSLLQVQVRLANAYPVPVTVEYATADSTATNGTDYIGASGTLTFVPGDTLEFIPVLIRGDGIDEGTEIINVNLSNAINASLSATTRSRITINDDDLLPAIVVSNISVTEKDITDTLIQIPVRLNRRYVETVTINYSSADSTATNGLDYGGVSGTLTFLPGDTLEFIPLNIRGDRIDESNEIIKLSYFGIVNATPASATSRVTITDNDVLPAVQFTNLSIAEGNSGGLTSLGLQVRLSRAYPLPVTVSYATEDSTAVNGDDYTGISGTIVFAPEETLQTINLPVNGDYITEGSEIIKLRFTNPLNATVSTTPSRITLTNDDTYPTVTASAATLTEGNTGSLNQVVTVRISKRYPLPVTVQLTTSDLTASAGVDYTTTAATVTFPANGDTLQTVLVPILGDLLDEANETYRITLSSTQYGILGSGGLFTATITDNDAVPSIRVNDTTAFEADGLMTFRVRLSAVSGRNVTVNWATQNGTALAGTDYTAATGGILTFLPGETLKEVTVSLLTDAESEGNETFLVVLSGAVNGTLTASQGGDATGIATIQNSTSTMVNRGISESGLVDGSMVPLQVKVLPNPSTNRFTLNLSGGGNEPIQFRVTDILGRVVEGRKLGAGAQTVQLGESWQNGTYILEVIQGTERKTLQLVKLK